MADTTTIEITVENWQRLNSKKRPGDSMNDVVTRLLDEKTETRTRSRENEQVRREPEVSAESDVSYPKPRRDVEAAADAAVEFIRNSGPVTMREIVAEVMPQHSLGYAVPDLEEGERYRGAWWRKCVKPALDARGDVEQDAGTHEWRVVE